MKSSEPSPPVGVVLAAHGSLAQALLDSAEMILGAQDRVVTAGLEPHDNLETYSEALQAAIERADQGSGVVVLIDLFGGTPGNAAALRMGQHKAPLPIVSGVNLPMLLEVLMAHDASSPTALAALALEAGNRGMIDVTARVIEQIRASQASPG